MQAYQDKSLYVVDFGNPHPGEPVEYVLFGDFGWVYSNKDNPKRGRLRWTINKLNRVFTTRRVRRRCRDHEDYPLERVQVFMSPYDPTAEAGAVYLCAQCRPQASRNADICDVGVFELSVSGGFKFCEHELCNTGTWSERCKKWRWFGKWLAWAYRIAEKPLTVEKVMSYIEWVRLGNGKPLCYLGHDYYEPNTTGSFGFDEQSAKCRGCSARDACRQFRQTEEVCDVD